MPRIPRVEYENAVYHVKARGDRRAPIVRDDEDRQIFVDTFSEACGRTGWEVFAWVLLDDHYHAVFRTPEPNLVAGMQWFQNVFTRRINARHGLRGDFFGDRYKAVPVEDEATSPKGSVVWRDHLGGVIDFVHLDPAREGVVDGKATSLMDYSWSSVATAYAKPPTKRPAWMAASEGLELLGYPDSSAGRKRFVERLDRITREEKGDPVVDGGETLSQHFERGWYWGSRAFRERLQKRLDSMGTRKSSNRSRRKGATSDHGTKRAKEIVEEAARHYGMTEKELRKNRRGDLRRKSAAWAVAMETSVPYQWIAEKLNLKSAANASQQIRLFRKLPKGELPKEVREWRESRNVA